MPETADQSAPVPPAPKSPGGRRALLALFVLTLTSLLYYRSYRHADALAFFGPSGKIAGLLSYRGQLFFASTNIDLGPERAWTIQTTAASSEEGAELHHLLLGEPSTGGKPFGGGNIPMNASGSSLTATPPIISQKWGFLAGQHKKDAFGLQYKWCTLLATPYWFLLPFALYPLITWSLRNTRLCRRKQKGCCLNCGYDLRGAKDRCPECGAELPIHQLTTINHQLTTNN